MAPFSSHLLSIFDWLLHSTVQASILICLILVTQLLLRHRLAPRWRYFLWLVLVLRMIMPWAPESRLSMFNLIPRSSRPRMTRPVPLHITGDTVKTITSTLPTSELEPTFPVGTFEPAPAAITPTPNVSDEAQGQPKALPSLMTILSFIWLVVSGGLAAWVCGANILLCRSVKRRHLKASRSVLCLLAECKAELGIRMNVSLVLTDKVTSPMLLGFLKPRLLLPPGIIEGLSLGELRYVFLHELAHLKRADILVGWVTTVLQVMHWFNPLVWLAFGRMRADRELACDALVLTHTRADESQDYGRTIVKLLESSYRRVALPGMVGILERKRDLRRRIAMIAHFRKSTYWTSVFAVAVLAILCAVSLTNAQSPETGALQVAQAPPDNSSSSASAAQESKDRPLRLVVELTDGSRIVGTSELETLAVHNPDYGKVNIRLKRVAAMEFEEDHKTVKVSFLNGDHLSGSLDLGALELETLFGKVSVPVQHVLRVSSAVPFVSPGAKFSGQSGVVCGNNGAWFDYVKIMNTEGALLFQENFHEGDLDRWWLGFAHDKRHLPPHPYLYGNWRKEGGALVQNVGWDYQMALIKNTTLSGHIIETRLKMNETAGYGGVVLWYRDENNWVALVIHPATRKIWVVCNNEGSFYHDLSSSPYDFAAAHQTWYHLKVAADGDTGKLTVYVDGKKLFTHDVTAPPRREDQPKRSRGAWTRTDRGKTWE